MTKEPKMLQERFVPWFGANVKNAPAVGELLKGCKWVGIPFAGGLAEVPHIKASTVVCNDLHRHLINLAQIAADPIYGPKLYRRLRRVAFSPWSLEVAQRACATYEADLGADIEIRLNFATDYYITCWMGRSGKAGTDGEFKGALPVRWNANGGDSAVRFSSAVLSLRAWRRVLARCNFVCMDAFAFLDKCQDELGHGIYCDPPFPGPGDGYKHNFKVGQHEKLAARLASFTKARVVCRFYDVKAIRDLYPESMWTWHHVEGRKQSNEVGPEVLLVRG